MFQRKRTKRQRSVGKICDCGGIGRRIGLKIRCPYGREGSSPSSRTKPKIGVLEIPAGMGGQQNYGGRSSIGRASGCGPEGCGFEAHRSPHGSLAQLVEQ